MIDNITPSTIRTAQKSAAMSCLSLNKIGQSKHNFRKEYNIEIREELRKNGMSADDIAKLPFYPSPYIHSIRTMNEYIKISKRYMCWACMKHPDVHRVRYAIKYVAEYLLYLINEGKSNYTIRTVACALAKLYRCRSIDFGIILPERHSSDIKKCRNYSETDYMEDRSKYSDIVELCRATGVRRIELEHLHRDDFILKDGLYHLNIDGKKNHPKGGRPRKVEIIAKNQPFIQQFVSAISDNGIIFNNVPSGINVHAIRALYAKDLYMSKARPVANIANDERIQLKKPKKDYKHPGHYYFSAPAIYRRRSDGQKFDRRALLAVSESLGHSRANVVALHYLYQLD